MTTPETPQPRNLRPSSTSTPSRLNELVQEWANGLEEPLITFDNLDDAIIGVGATHTQPHRVVYSYDRIITLLLQHGMSHEEAIEFFDFNIGGMWAGENTPIIMYDINSL